MFVHQDQEALIITDTLATTEDGTPRSFFDKALAFPAMNLVAATTGYGELLNRWASCLRAEVLARDITMLDLHTPAQLRAIWADLQREHGPLEGTATVYHFGIDEQTGECVRITYRSKDDFVSERATSGGFGIKPEPLSGEVPEIGSLDDLIDLAKQIRAEQDALAPEERVYIGGDLILTRVAKHAISSERIYRFEDQYDHWQSMNGADPTGVIARLR